MYHTCFDFEREERLCSESFKAVSSSLLVSGNAYIYIYIYLTIKMARMEICVMLSSDYDKNTFRTQKMTQKLIRQYS